MKMNRLFTKMLAGLALAGLWLALISPSRADNQTNANAVAATNDTSINISAGHQNSGNDNYYGLPKEAFDRLSPEQIVALAEREQANRGENPPNVAIVVPLGLFAFIVICVALGISQRVKRNRMLHDTLRLMIEKGQPIPPELLQPTGPQRRSNCDLRRGLIWSGVGVGLGVCLLVQHQYNWPVALIPLLIGVAFLITWKLETNKNGQPH